MSGPNRNMFFILAVISLTPSLLWATRGPDDYGLIFGLSLWFFTIPVCVMLIAFMLYSRSKLKSAEKPREKQGRAVFALSLAAIVLSAVLPLLLMHASGWNETMAGLMTGVYLPALLLAVTSALLAAKVKKRSRE